MRRRAQKERVGAGLSDAGCNWMWLSEKGWDGMGRQVFRLKEI